MADVTIVKRGGKLFPPAMTVNLGGLEVSFVRSIVDGERAMVATLDDGDPGAAVAIQQAAMMPQVFRVHAARAPKVTPIDPKKKPVEAPKASAELTPKDIALRNGWEASDLEGAGQGDRWGPDGGRATVTGLTMAEMALCSPPKGYDRTKGYPWDMPGWRGPAADWKPPGTPAKATKKKPAPAAAVQPEPELAADEDEEAPKAPVPASLEGYGTAEEVVQAKAVLQELAKASGAIPTRQKAAYHFRKHGLPAPSDEQFQALTQTLTP